MKPCIQSFFSRTFESELNERMMERSFALSTKEVENYLRSISNLSCSTFVEFILHDMARCGITTADVPQFSSWDEGTDNICEVISKAGDRGFTHAEIGCLLFHDGKVRNKIACRKYGEGHAKLAKCLGLLQEIDKTYFLSCVGYVWGTLNRILKDKLYTRFLLRFNLIQFLLQQTQNGGVEFKTVARNIGLSEWGCYRRHSNVKCILDRLCATDEYDFSTFRSKVDIDSMLRITERVGE